VDIKLNALATRLRHSMILMHIIDDRHMSVGCMCRLAEKYNMKLLFTVPFADYFQQNISNHANRGLIGRMQGLEVDCYELFSKISQTVSAYKIQR